MASLIRNNINSFIYCKICGNGKVVIGFKLRILVHKYKIFSQLYQKRLENFKLQRKFLLFLCDFREHSVTGKEATIHKT